MTNLPEKEDLVNIGASRFLFLDPSSTCTGFCVAEVDFGSKSAKIVSAGPLWFGNDWDQGKKLKYIFNAIRNYFFIVGGGVSHIICEEYFFAMGPNAKVMGSMVVPEMIGVVTLAAADEDPALDLIKISASEWRKILGIKPDVTEKVDKETGKVRKVKNYKDPVARYVKNIIKVPETFTSNITGSDRQTPDDVTDCLALTMAFLQRYGITRFTTQDGWDTGHLCLSELV